MHGQILILIRDMSLNMNTSTKAVLNQPLRCFYVRLHKIFPKLLLSNFILFNIRERLRSILSLLLYSLHYSLQPLKTKFVRKWNLSIFYNKIDLGFNAFELAKLTNLQVRFLKTLIFTIVIHTKLGYQNLVNYKY